MLLPASAALCFTIHTMTIHTAYTYTGGTVKVVHRRGIEPPACLPARLPACLPAAGCQGQAEGCQGQEGAAAIQAQQLHAVQDTGNNTHGRGRRHMEEALQHSLCHTHSAQHHTRAVLNMG